ncbi:SAM-dependent methyltransferase [Dickeya dianthicola]|uniref:SAM-dependent methyltransferase n=1 Tax=Dickeya dianthicola TaxID=204039 RepID=UPI00136EF3E0|nr:SAM-dependent methyltransferase [Dickeya dianthicola]MCI4237224.1 SAM-dependent methyltransferase [Dickeya dianthicola]MCI4255196.1 SAM-dependent methyltransferase [Dickeya dianthicola]MZG21302.1 SAM-dependent methyltransferase [Dickeya dianthicola]MZI88510.1 SAM-dependent methyltransferase [Dickeya dianthicola]
MTTDFEDACERHWRDAETLFNLGRWANADHLYGFSAESGLKKLMLAFDMPFDTDRDMPSNPNDKKHIDTIWLRYETYRSGQITGTDYLLSSNNPFDDWKASQRYSNQQKFTQIEAEKHRNGAEQVKNILKQAKMDGAI